MFIFEFLSRSLDLTQVTYATLIACVTFLITNFMYDMRFRRYLSRMAGKSHLAHVYNKRPTKSNKIYVAGSWMQRAYLQTKMTELRKLNYLITSNWPTFETKLDNPDDYAECSRLDIDGVVNADTVLAFMTDPAYPYRGTCTEIGCAIGSGRRIIVICDGTLTKKNHNDHKKTDERMSDKFDFTFSHMCMNNVFFWDPRIEHVSSFEDALKLLRGEKVESPYKACYSGKISAELAKNSDATGTLIGGIGEIPDTTSPLVTSGLSEDDPVIKESDLILTN